MNIIDLEFKLVTLSYVMLTYNLLHVKEELLKLVFDIKRNRA